MSGPPQCPHCPFKNKTNQNLFYEEISQCFINIFIFRQILRISSTLFEYYKTLQSEIDIKTVNQEFVFEKCGIINSQGQSSAKWFLSKTFGLVPLIAPY